MKALVVSIFISRIQKNMVPNVLLNFRIFRINTTALLGNDGDGDNRVLKLVQELQQMD